MKKLLKYIEVFFHSIIRSKIIFLKNGETFQVDSLDKFDVIIYLPTPPSSYYQLSQWLAPLRELNKKYKIAIVTRNIATFIEASKQSYLPVIQIQKFNKLRFFYKEASPKIVLYVNNSLKNNQSLLHKNGYHVHLNHGESEKECMSSNQSKAYDYVLTAGQRGFDRYKENLLNFDKDKYLKVGRPQLDFIDPILLESPKKKILYAPTWEAHYTEMDYCSLEKHGLRLIREIIAAPNYILIYKPHPLIGSKRKSVKKIHNQIKDIIKKSNDAYYYQNINILNLFDSIDFAFFDNTSVMIDYLCFDKPGAYIEIRKDIQSNNILKAYYQYDEGQQNISITSFINSCTLDDNKNQTRLETKIHYLGDYQKGESTEKFISTISSLINQRNTEINDIANNQ